MWAGVSKSGSPISRWTISRPARSRARVRASTSKADSVPSLAMRPATLITCLSQATHVGRVLTLRCRARPIIATLHRSAPASSSRRGRGASPTTDAVKVETPELLDCDAPGSERRRRQRRIAEDELEALRRGLYAVRYPGERSRAVAHVDGAETCEDRAAIRVDGAATGFTHNVHLLRLTKEGGTEQKSLKVSGRRAVPRHVDSLSESEAIAKDAVV